MTVVEPQYSILVRNPAGRRVQPGCEAQEKGVDTDDDEDAAREDRLPGEAGPVQG